MLSSVLTFFRSLLSLFGLRPRNVSSSWFIRFARIAIFILAIRARRQIFGVLKNEIDKLVKDFSVKCNQLYVDALSKIVDKYREAPNLPTHVVRMAFRDAVLPLVQTTNPTHTHPDCAAWRSSCMVFARILGHVLGFKPYSYQGSTADVRDGVDYCRDYRWDKDTLVPAVPSNITGTHLVVIVDVDYYLDLERFLMSNDQPVLLYSFQPVSLACASGEFSFSFNSNDEVTYRVSGGQLYQHQVWNFAVDTFTVSHFTLAGWMTKVYQVERRAANAHHEYIFLIPIGKWTGVMASLAASLKHAKLERLHVNRGVFNMLDVQTDTGLTRCLARVDEFNVAKVPIDIFNAIESNVRNSQVRTGVASIQGWLDKDRAAASVLHDYFCAKYGPTKPPVVYPAINGVKKYQFIKGFHELDVLAKSVMVSYMSPVLPNTYAPARTFSNEVAAVKGRVLDPADDSKSLMKKPSRFLMQMIDEFVDHLVPEDQRHKGVPCTIEEVYLKQNRPSQRQLLNQAEADPEDDEPVVKTFLKAEPYQKPSDPRVISQINTVDKREYSRYTYPFSAFISSSCKWYSFGKTPKQIAESVANICKHAIMFVNCADCVRQDGHVSEIARLLEHAIMAAWTSPEFHADLFRAMEAQYKCKAVTPNGFKYLLEFQRASGSPETAIFNSILTKFCDYMARRMMNLLPKPSYEAPGEFGGDDSITADVDDAELSEAGALVGQRIESVVFHRNEPGVNYLSRFYGQAVWYGDESSTCDLPRALGKLHVTPSLTGFTPLQKLQQKLIGLCRTDGNTPILSDIISAALRVGVDLSLQPSKQLTGWWAHYEVGENWPNEVQNDESEYLDRMLGDCDVQPLKLYLSESKCPEDLLTMPIVKSYEFETFPEVKQTVVIDDDVVLEPVVPPKDSTKPVVAPAADKPVCWDFVDRKCTYGKKCKFEHVPVCKQFIDGTCARKNCKFKHAVRNGPRAT